MKFIKKETVDDVNYYSIRFNSDEIRILFAMLFIHQKHIPKLMETTSLRGRIKAMLKGLIDIKHKYSITN